ncbi:hypothetical protein ASE67_12970 [Sphingomonas sp. Leaf23]|uniref:YcxB family protein n=1 Tax=Sphingomonas sp. Leaf23 TaxID=1735689 RepID=UPI0006FA5842|nr:YcxB family protein [Sphingomonas sp. Leaf23]KQM85332.1 hypothetical protein ASE67_12970 [Sphingomonas sp. Leaf23]
MAMHIHYASTRAEVWRYYWRLWRQRMWKAHLAVFVVLATLLFAHLSERDWPIAAGLTAAVLANCIPLVCFILYPMLRFNPEVRELSATADGLQTSIGRRHAAIPWCDIAAIESVDGTLVIRRSDFNGLIVPARAFASDEARLAFERFVRAQVDAAHGG